MQTVRKWYLSNPSDMAAVAILRAMRSLKPTLDDYPDLTAQMLYCACPTPENKPFFTLHMAVALNLGLTWVESLQYVIEQRDGTIN
jgi:hypothetical protein